MPTTEARKNLFEINFKDVKLSSCVEFDKLLKATTGYTGCDITTICRDAA